MNNKNNFLESPLFVKIKETIKITADKEFFLLITNHFISNSYLSVSSNLLDYFNILLKENIVDKGDISDIYLNELNKLKDLHDDNTPDPTVTKIDDIDFVLKGSLLFEKIVDIMVKTHDIEFFNLITNYLLDTGTLNETTNLCFYFGELGIRKLITHEDVGKWYLQSIHIDAN
ncbi:hypothetical protein [Dethiothermospora halolimnae]|uniref:hypothetical protein n=1 Tax=Dethiothermospora halolimnae TaxID=3114390 RepID=UPI003CCBB4A1